MRQRILGLLLMQPQKSWYRLELAKSLNVSPSSLQRELIRLTHAGILESRTDNSRSYFRANRDSPLFTDLRSLFEKTTGLVDVLREVLRSVADRIDVAFVYGSIAHESDSPTSDVDLLVIGDVALSDLLRPLREAERGLSRPVNAKTLTRAEFGAMMKAKNHFLSGVLEGKKLFVLGSRNELESAHARGSRGAAEARRDRVERPSRHRRAKPR